MARKIEVEILGDSRSLERAFARSANQGSRLGRALGVGLKGAAIAGGAALAGLGVAAKIGFDEFQDAEKVTAQTNAVLKSTGGAANVTAKEIDNLADSLLQKTGIDDEAIKSGENLLLTFTNIRNEAGKGNDIFNQATTTITDMSVALGQDFKSSAIQVGKALNDPILGMTALRRVGVSFTKGQTETVKSLVESGKSMEAQKLILRELTKEFGGSAEAAGTTFAGKLNVLKENFRNTAGEVVAAFMPVLLQVANVVLPLLARAFQLVGEGIEKLTAFFKRDSKVIGQASAAIRSRVIPVFHAIGRAIFNFWSFIVRTFIPVWRKLAEIASESVQRIAAVFKANEPQLRRIWERVKVVMQAFATVLRTVVLPIVRLFFVEVLPRVLNVAIKAIDLISGAIASFVGWIRTLVSWVQSAIDALTTLAGKISGVAGGIGGIVGKIPGLASGGPVVGGRPYVVGESGPELFVPSSGGRIVSNGALGGGGGGGGVQVLVLGGDASAISWLKRVLEDDSKRNGGRSVLEGA